MSKMIANIKRWLSQCEIFQVVQKSSVTDRLTDTSKYGGTHKQRFDDEGKGRGKSGRADAKGDGYVSGYKHKDSYDKAH